MKINELFDEFNIPAIFMLLGIITLAVAGGTGIYKEITSPPEQTPASMCVNQCALHNLTFQKREYGYAGSFNGCYCINPDGLIERIY